MTLVGKHSWHGISFELANNMVHSLKTGHSVLNNMVPPLKTSYSLPNNMAPSMKTIFTFDLCKNILKEIVGSRKSNSTVAFAARLYLEMLIDFILFFTFKIKKLQIGLGSA